MPKASDVLDQNGAKIINLATPTASGDAATKGYVDSVATGGGFSGDAALIPYAAAVPYPVASGANFDQVSIGASVVGTPMNANTVRGGLVVLPTSIRISAFGLVVSSAASSGTDTTFYSIYEAASGSFYPGNRLYISPSALTGFSTTGHKTQALDMTLAAYKAYWFFAHFASNPSVLTITAEGTRPIGWSSATTTSPQTSYSASRAIGTPMANPFNVSGGLSTSSPPIWRFIAY